MAKNLQVASAVSSTAQPVKDQDGNTSSLTLSTDKVGIGTSTPGAKLDVAGELQILADPNTIHFTSVPRGWPSGRGSPFDVMTAHETRILGIGKPIEVLTHVHHVEDLMGEDFPVPRLLDSDLKMTLIDGEDEIPFTLRREGFAWKRNNWKLRKIMGPAQLREWRFHNVHLFTTKARDVTAALKDAAERGVTIFEKP